MRVSKMLFYGITIVAVAMTFIVIKGKSEGVFNPMLQAEKLPKWLSFITEKKA